MYSRYPSGFTGFKVIEKPKFLHPIYPILALAAPTMICNPVTHDGMVSRSRKPNMIRLSGKVSGSLSHRLLLGRSFRIIIVNQRTHRAIIRAAPTGVPAAQVERDDIARR